MAGYIGVSTETDPEVLTDQALESLVAFYPGFVPREANLEVWLLEVVARLNAETRYLFNLVPDSIFRYFGESLVGVPPVEGVPATSRSDWTMVDAAGYTIPEGTQVAYRVAGDQLVLFSTVEERVVAPGETVAFGVRAEAISAGASLNGLGPAALELVDSLAYVSSVVATLPTSGAVDAEEDDEYLSRLRAEMRLLTPRFVLARDAAVLSRRIGGVHRALGLDNYNPGDDTFGNEKMVTVAVVAEDGQPLSAGVKTEVGDYLESIRELNFIVHVVDPTYTVVNVTFAVVANLGFDLASLEGRAVQAVEEYLSPATWAGGNDEPPVWKTTGQVVRYLEVAEVLNRVEGVDYVATLTLNGSSADVTLSGVAPLPSVGTVTGSATGG